MCVAAIAWKAHPHWLLVAIGNRDEYHDRPSAPLARWDDPDGIIAGRDLRSGGTWLGVSQAGRFALVTNLRGHGPPDPGRVSRGHLVVDQLAGIGPHANPDTADLSAFNPFNLILADRSEARFLSNRPGPIRTVLGPGLYGLSNGTLDEPWPKTLCLKAALLDWLNRPEHAIEPLFAALANDTLPAIGLHPAQPSDIAQEPSETPVFIRNPVYGTRCSTIVAISQDGSGLIVERRFAPDGAVAGESSLAFDWQV